MITVDLVEAKDQLTSLMDVLSKNSEPISISRNGVTAAVLVSAKEYASMEETLHLFSTESNANEILQSLADYRTGKFQPGELSD